MNIILSVSNKQRGCIGLGSIEWKYSFKGFITFINNNFRHRQNNVQQDDDIIWQNPFCDVCINLIHTSGKVSVW